MTFNTPASEHAIRFWRARFGTSNSANTVTCQYATDLRDTANDVSNFDVQGSGYIWGDSGTVWGSFTWGTDKEKQADLSVPGEYRRIQLRYVHSGARQYVRFLGHTLTVMTRRMR